MFLGYQNNIARYIKNTREELDAIRNVNFDRIEEVEFAEMLNGVIYTSEEELLQAQTKAVEETRAGLYAAQVDPITAHINRLRDEEMTPEVMAEIAELVEERKLLVEEIKANNPYPDAIEETKDETEETTTTETETTTAATEIFEQYSMEI